MTEIIPEQPSFVLRYILFVLNTVLWIISLAIFGLAIYIMIESQLFDKIKQLLKANSTSTPAVTLVQPFLIILISFMIVITTMLGCVGALRENTYLLICYMDHVYGYTNTWTMFTDTQIHEPLRAAIKFYLDDEDLTDTINQVQRSFQCCGIDRECIHNWQDNRYFGCKKWDNATTAEEIPFDACSVPWSCCNIQSIKPDRTCGKGVLCQDGCMIKLKNLVEKHAQSIVIAIGITMSFFIVIVIITECLIRDIEDVIDYHQPIHDICA
ncbi:unnamed protein product [Didymodactylos carnosus]|uniref:Tetraspanin n=1 Tax=Didymodactylos carnosus TaxID=1234261 RepID=A0A8S2I316_9BILA|nr:unnamed protein product [Didymodactylos carnosus]CAF3709560.1 unnamed protein product [Didymodactylos carnosus]